MSKYEKLLEKILLGRSDSNISFDDDELVVLLNKLGFSERIRGSHHNFSKAGIIEKINLQKDGSNAKNYQVKQVRNIILKYNLGDKI